MGKINSTLLDIEKKITEDYNYKDPKVFDVDAEIDDSLFVERAQFKKLAENLGLFLLRDVRNHSLVIGPRGSGKTALVKYLVKELVEFPKFPEFEPIYVNCRGFDNSYKIIKEIIKERKKVAKDDLLNSFYDFVTKDGIKKIIILDEVDLLKEDSLLYHVTRDNKLNNLLMILITKTPKFYKNLTEDVRSSMKKEDFAFDSYDYGKIREILTKRAERGFYSYDPDILFQIAVENFNFANGDIRVGIKVLDSIFRYKDYPKAVPNGISGKKKIPEEIKIQIRSTIEEEYQKIKTRIINNLNDVKLAILNFAIHNKLSNEAFRQYKENTRGAITKPYFFKMVDELAYMDLLERKKIRINRFSVYEYSENIGEQNITLIKDLLEQRGVLINNEEAT